MQGCLETVDVFTLQLNVGGAKDWYCQPLVIGSYIKGLPGCYSGHFNSGALNLTHLSEIRNKYIPVKLTDKH